MARQISRGVPERSKSYVYPVDDRRVLRRSVAAAVAVLLLLIILHFIGVRRVASPGKLANAHAPIELQCAQCHQVLDQVSSSRCARCHDRELSLRLTHNAHVLFGSRDPRKADQADDLECVHCHPDHRGRAFELHLADAKRCADCHRFSSLETHPEFAAVRAGLSSGGGIRFDHDRHIRESEKQIGRRCAFCHTLSADTGTFAGLSYDRQCARCHERLLLAANTDPIDLRQVLPFDRAPAQAGRSGALESQSVARGRHQVRGFLHRDGWVLVNLLYLRRQIEPGEELAERLTLQAQLEWLRSQSLGVTAEAYESEDLDRLVQWLTGSIEALDRRIHSPRDPQQERRELQKQSDWVNSMLASLGKTIPTQAVSKSSLVRDTVVTDVDPKSDSDAVDDRSLLHARREELIELIDAVRSRGDAALARRASRLRSRVEQLQSGRSAESPDQAGLLDMLLGIDDLLVALNNVRDRAVNVETARLRVLRDFGIELVGRGLEPTEFEARREELVALLEALERKAPPEFGRRSRELKQRLFGLRAGLMGDGFLKRERVSQSRLLELVRLDQELGAGPTVDMSQVVGRRSQYADGSLMSRLADRLARLSLPTPVAAAPDLETAERTLDSLLLPCAKCHQQRGGDLAPVWVEDSVMPRARFDHRPHLRLSKCEACHTTIVNSRAAGDVNVPGVDQCRSCHGRSGVRASCDLCHDYHPKSASALAAMGP